MKRRKFLTTTGFLAGGSAIFFAFKNAGLNPTYFANNSFKELGSISDQLETDFQQLLLWLKENGWASYFKTTIGANLELKGDDLKAELIKKIDDNKLSTLRQNTKSGF